MRQDKMTTGFEGVRPASESSIEIGFVYKGKYCVERIRVKPTAANLQRAVQRRMEILQQIADGTFKHEVKDPSPSGKASA